MIAPMQRSEILSIAGEEDPGASIDLVFPQIQTLAPSQLDVLKIAKAHGFSVDANLPSDLRSYTLAIVEVCAGIAAKTSAGGAEIGDLIRKAFGIKPDC